MSEPQIYPLLPLRGMMIFPYMIINFDVGRARSLAAVETANRNDKKIFLTAQRDENTQSPEMRDLYEMGTVAEIKQVMRLPNGGARVVVEGLGKARLLQLNHEADFDLVAVQPEHDMGVNDSQELTALVRAVVHKFEEWVKLSKQLPAEALISVAITDDLPRMADVISGHLNLRLDQKQELLSTLDLRQRLGLLFNHLQREIEIQSIEQEIESKFRARVEKVQKEFYLREKIKAIHEELGDDISRDGENQKLKDRLAAGDYPEAVKEAVEKEIQHLAGMSVYSQEAAVARTYVEWLLDLPWNVSTEDNDSLKQAAEILDRDHYGLEKVKERILDYLAVRKLTKDSGESDARRAPILCLVGPPGVGKTSLASSIARATGRNFVRAALGGVHDEAELRGHRRTYVGALPGRIIEGIKKAGTKNPVFLLDEVDKLNSDFRGNPAAALLEILDPVQSEFFTDHYIGLPFDLSEVLWIVTANNGAEIPRALRDRLEIVELSSYTAAEKEEIAKGFLVSRARKATGLKAKDVAIGLPVIRRLINEYTREAGVRELERTLTRLCRKVAREIVENEDSRGKTIRLKASELEKYLERPRYGRTRADHKAKVGVVTGMAWTSVGGDILPTEVAVLPGKGQLILTGQLGDVMKESARAGLSYIRSRSKALKLPDEFYEKNDIHIHLPEGAIPKDGPSAGITMATAMISALTGRKVRGDVAMTGEITLRGRVLAIGGLKEKVLAAHREGMKTIILPKENEKDIADIPEAVRKDLEFVPVETMDEVLRHVWEV
ncbi:MAG: endopeptidase La [Selenomonadaceae bacterium]|nr:endopeptidase La [Selenomonadaceae bacterium]